MSWQDILKISTEEAIQDAKRFAPKVVDEAQEEENKKKRENILNEWEKMGLLIDRTYEDEDDYFLYLPRDKYNEPSEMFDSHFYGMIAKGGGFGFIVEMPKYPYTGREKISVPDIAKARQVGRTYLDRYERAVKDYTGPDGKWSYKKDKE